ncbi:hypothetical protein [Mycobacterium sp. DL440]|uniref:hypothetical protein n=1 Tax=Mycobacterium sp. DL440 TaxID=2675523 RepID=UPI001FBA149C|nr:hypothetical protein [Mycobacterium sp. DL440]
MTACILSGCGIFGSSANRNNDRFARPDHPKDSPSGQYEVSAAMGPEQNGVETWVAVIRDKATDAEVFRDSYAYSTRHGINITWLSASDQLWLFSSDVGTAHVDRQRDEAWVKTSIYPETTDDIPEEINALID